MKIPKNNGGFTLTELLVASILISIVLSAVYTLFSGSIRTWKFMEQEYNVDQRTRNIITLFGREVECLLPAAFYLFEGTDTELTLYTLGDAMNLEVGEGARLLQVQYRYNPVKNEIIREEGIVSADFPPMPAAGTELDRTKIKVEDESENIVASHVTEFKLRYIWMPLPPMRNPLLPPEPITPVYLEEQRNGWGYPQAVELSVTLQDQDGKLHSRSSTIPLRMETPYLPQEILTLRQGEAKI